ncbi:hypothetical protein E4L96_07830 [Massilia arenosa]|uniref:Uncharacterized protein n=1 Tax=Zemynaea arenosa TaxID=2561931 RepID=A0A4Y9SFL3_9BURK|nr:hypothetical protein [Massilia arenosa]TFW22431.1 hypothetical protein E4L96_07830 [Massilia arenosa]
MRLPGTRYQEHGWEQVRKLLGQCSLHVLDAALIERLCAADARAAALADYVDALALALHGHARRHRGEAPGNSYGDSVAELALMLAYELQARASDGEALAAAIAAERARLGDFWQRPEGAALLRKKVNDAFAVLRDKVDSDNYMAACGRPCSPNRMYAYRMLDTASSDIARLFADWRSHRAQVSAILGRPIEAEPIEARQMQGVADCRAEWILRWSATLEEHTGSPGPLDTKSKRFDSLKGSAAKIQQMLDEIAEYEQLSANREADWRLDEATATDWLDDLASVFAAALGEGPDQILPPEDGNDDDAQADPVSASPRYQDMARSTQDRRGHVERSLSGVSEGARLAVYLKLLGPADDSYPPDWLMEATGELPTMQQLAARDGVSLPTLRKRRDEAIARLQSLAGAGEGE